MIELTIGIALLIASFILILCISNKNYRPFSLFLFFFIITAIMCFVEVAKKDVDYQTNIVKRYQQGNYAIEVTIDGDKVDTLYIFK